MKMPYLGTVFGTSMTKKPSGLSNPRGGKDHELDAPNAQEHGTS